MGGGSTMVSGRTIGSMARGTLSGQTGGSTAESTSKINVRVMESFPGPMDDNTQVNGSKVVSMAKESTGMPRERPRRAFGRRGSVRANGFPSRVLKTMVSYHQFWLANYDF